MRPEVAASLLIVAAREPGMSDDLYATMLRLYVRAGRRKSCPFPTLSAD